LEDKSQGWSLCFKGRLYAEVVALRDKIGGNQKNNTTGGEDFKSLEGGKKAQHWRERGKSLETNCKPFPALEEGNQQG